MSVRNTESGWGWPARAIHWVMALMIVASLVAGTILTNMSDFTETGINMAKIEGIYAHKSFGFVIFWLAVLRVGWRFANPSPRLPAEMPRWQVRASHASHYALYALIFIVPLSGWLMATSSPQNDPDAYGMVLTNEVFGLFPMPDPYPEGVQAVTDFFHTVHGVATKLLMGILVIHVGAAMKHHFVDRDAVLRRMVRG